jgi:hypothetical protein
LNKQQFDANSKKYVKLYEKMKKRGETPLKREVIEYCVKAQLIQKGKCSFLKNSRVRNSIAHANAYYDEKNKKIVFGKHKMNIDEFKKYFEELLNLNSYMIKYYFEKTNFRQNFTKSVFFK